MFVEAVTNDGFVPIALNRYAAKNDDKHEAYPPGNKNTTGNYSNNSEASNGEKTMIEHQKRKSGDRYCACEEYLDRPVILEKFLDLLQGK